MWFGQYRSTVDKGLDSGSRKEATMAPDKEPRTYYEIEKSRLDNPGEPKVGNDVSQLPPHPSGSPWSSDPCGPEPPVDRSEDSDVMGIEIDLLNR
jgi:hypothetical protein